MALKPNTGPVPNSEAALCLPYQYTVTVCAASIWPPLTPSNTWNGCTTAPPCSRSILSRPPAMSLTRVMYWLAISVKMSVAGHEVCIFRVVVCARETCGIAMVAAPVAPAASRNLRRVGILDVLDFSAIENPPSIL